jgi:hypothetical protein
VTNSAPAADAVVADATLVEDVAFPCPIRVKCERARDPRRRSRDSEPAPCVAAVIGPPVLSAVRERECLANGQRARGRHNWGRTMWLLNGCGMTVLISPPGRSLVGAQLAPWSALIYTVPSTWS